MECKMLNIGDIKITKVTTEKDYYRLKKKIDGIKYLKTKLKIVDEEKLINVILKKDEIY